MPKTLLSKQDRYSFLVPAFGFENPTQTVDTKFSHVCDPVRTEGRTYVAYPRTLEKYTTALLEIGQLPSKGDWTEMSNGSNPRPDDSYGVALTIGGKRKYRLGKVSQQQLYGFNPTCPYKKIDHDCFVMWGRDNGKTPPPVYKNGLQQIHPLCNGKGVIYTLQTKLAENGSPAYKRCVCLLVRFKIFCQEGDVNCKLCVNLVDRILGTCVDHRSEEEPELVGVQLGTDWRRLINNAHDGFIRTCSSLPLIQ